MDRERIENGKRLAKTHMEQWFPMDQMKVTKKGKEVPVSIKAEKKGLSSPGGPMRNPTRITLSIWQQISAFFKMFFRFV